MSEIIERVAAAICVANSNENCDYEKMARAAIEAMRGPTAEMVARAFPCERDQEFDHEDKKIGAAACLILGGGKDIGLLEGDAVKQAAFLVRDYRLMIDEALR